MDYTEAKNALFRQLGSKKIMALATSVADHVSIRNVSCILYNDRIYFKTDKNFAKTKQLLENPNVAMCHWGISIEGVAKNLGLVAEEEGQIFANLYKKYWWESYNAYSHEDTELLFEVTPTFAEIWDQDSQQKGFQTFIDFKEETATMKQYD